MDDAPTAESIDDTRANTTVAPVRPQPSVQSTATSSAGTAIDETGITDTISSTAIATTAAATTAAATTAAPTSSVLETTVSSAQLTDQRVEVSIVLANGDGRFNLVGRNADRLLALGYVEIDQTDVGDRPPATIIYYRPGFDDEAERLAGDLQTPNATITALPDTPVTGNDAAGELVVVLGPDALR